MRGVAMAQAPSAAVVDAIFEVDVSTSARVHRRLLGNRSAPVPALHPPDQLPPPPSHRRRPGLPLDAVGRDLEPAR